MSGTQKGDWIGKLASFGYGSKGVVYVMIGVLAAMAACSSGGKTTGSGGVLSELQSWAFGPALLVMMGFGLAAYGIYRGLGAFADIESEGRDGKGLGKRLGYLGSAIAYIALSYSAFTLVGGGSDDSGGSQSLSGKAMTLPFGRWLVGAVGIGIFIAGIFQWNKAIKRRYREMFDLDGEASNHRKLIERVAKVGLMARGIVFPLIGFFLLKAAFEFDSGETKGIGGVLEQIGSTSPWLLGIVSLGLVCYGLYCWVIACYGRWRHPRS